jgi:hypothetical protein
MEEGFCGQYVTGVGYESMLQLNYINEVETSKKFFVGKIKKKLGDWL